MINKPNKVYKMKKKVSLVLSSGGARGLAHIGIIKELENRDYEIVSVSGTSMGSLVGGIYASGNLEKLVEWLYSLSTVDILKLFDFILSKNGLVKGDKVYKEMQKIIPDYEIENLLIPFVAVSTDLMNNKEIIHDKGSLYQAIRASTSIPTFFQPVKSNDTYLVDGGLLNPTPVNRIKRFEDDILVVVNVESQKNKTGVDNVRLEREAEPEKKINTLLPKGLSDQPGYFKILEKTIGIMLNRISELTIEKYNPDILITIDREKFGTYDFHKYDEIIRLGEEIAREKINEYESGNN
jgi:NTE family protein